MGQINGSYEKTRMCECVCACVCACAYVYVCVCVCHLFTKRTRNGVNRICEKIENTLHHPACVRLSGMHLHVCVMQVLVAIVCCVVTAVSYYVLQLCVEVPCCIVCCSVLRCGVSALHQAARVGPFRMYLHVCVLQLCVAVVCCSCVLQCVLHC